MKSEFPISLMIHGLKGSPHQMKFMSQFLRRCGVATESVLLSGHGTRPEDLLKISYRQWIRDVEMRMSEMRSKNRSVILSGYSFGGTLAIYGALQFPELVKGLILISPSLIYRDPRVKLLPWLTPILSPIKKWVEKNPENIIEGDPFSYQKTSLKSVAEVAKFSQIIERVLRQEKVRCPMIVVYGQDDEIIDIKGSLKLLEQASVINQVILLKTAHPLKHSDIVKPEVNPSMDEMLNEIWTFIQTSFECNSSLKLDQPSA